jgi:hypothetical protein
MAYRQSLPDDEIRSIMGRAIPLEWTVNLFSMGKEWQAYQQQQNMLKMTGKSPRRSSEGKRKNN